MQKNWQPQITDYTIVICQVATVMVQGKIWPWLGAARPLKLMPPRAGNKIAMAFLFYA